MINILIITGGSKGIGSGIVSAYKSNGYKIYSIARSINESAAYSDVIQVQLDLSEAGKIESVFSEILDEIDPITVKRIVLINNAGTLGKIGTLDKSAVSDIQSTIQLNLTTPFVLNSILLRKTKSWNCLKKIINISSGAAVKAYFGWSLYCATKAAMDMMTKVLAVEQESIGNEVEIIAIYPGVVDTSMQVEIRNSDSEDFIDLEKFVNYKETNVLVSVETVGKEIYDIDVFGIYQNGTILNVSDYR
jgi:benzil reductase ((S)-benzoin forming)